MTDTKQRYLYLISLTPKGVRSRIGRVPCSPHIGWTTNPIRCLNEHNRIHGRRSGRKTTQAGAPYWQLELVIEGINHNVSRFRDQWRSNSRKLERRIIYGIVNAAKYQYQQRNSNIIIYARDKVYTRKLLNKHTHLIATTTTTV